MFLLYNKKDMIPCFNIVVCDEMGYLEKQVVLKTLWEVGCGMCDMGCGKWYVVCGMW